MENNEAEREQLEQAIAHIESQRAVLGDAVVDATIATLCEKLAALKAPTRREQRKQVTVLFADVSGFTAMSETMDAEDVNEIMNALWRQLDGAITKHGGTIDKHIGDAVMALFGAPSAREDDPERAIRAALAMQAELAAFREARQITLAMRIGINTGPVLLGEVGTTAEYTALGDTVNLASRLEHAAPVGGILISHATYRHVRGLFDVQALEPISVKGKAEPVQVHVVLGAKPHAFRVTTRGVEGVETRMIGRDADLQRLREALSAVTQAGEIRVVTIVGEAGVGKSRLLYEFDKGVKQLSGPARSFKGRASEQMSHMPYALFRDLFARHFEIQDSDRAVLARDKLEQGIVAFMGAEGEEQAHFIGQLFGFDFSASPYLRGIIGDARQIHDRAFHYVTQFFAVVTRQSPAIIYLEDIHWADEGTLDLADHLARECRRAPLLIIALTRPEFYERRPSWGQGQEFYTRLELHPLSERDSRRLVEEILRKVEEIPPDLRELIVRGAEGNPFYVEELIKMLIEDGVIVKGDERWQVEMGQLAEVRVPPTLTGVLQARLDGLPMLERETLQRASVVGRTFWDIAVERIFVSAGQPMGDSQINAALQTLQGRELIFERETSAFARAQEYTFKHAVLRDVTYESVLKRLRRTYHAQVAEWLIEWSGERVREYAGLIGEHYERAGAKTQAAEWYGRAGKQARDTYALETAAGYYQRALALEERWEWRKGQVEVLHILGRRENEHAALSVLEAVSGAPTFDVAYLWGQYYEAVGEYGQARAAVERAMVTGRDRGDLIGQVRCLAQLGLIARRQGDYEGAKECFNQALSLLQGRDVYSDEEARAFAQALNGLGTVHLQQGDFDRAKVCYERALELSRTSGDRRGEAQALSDLGGITFYQRNFTAASDYHRQALEIRRAIGDRVGEGTSLYNLAQTTRDAGDYGRARGYLSEALSIHQATGNRFEEVNVWNEMGIIYHELGDLNRAETCLRRGLELSQQIGDEAGQAYLKCNLGQVKRDLGDLAAAEQLLSDGLSFFHKENSKYGMSFFLSYLSTVSLQAGRLEEAAERANMALTLRQELDMRMNTTDDLATLAAIHLRGGDVAQALSCAQDALDILDECGGEGPEFPQRDYFICYQVLAAAGQEKAARAALQSAYGLIVARANKITDPALRESFMARVPINREIVQAYGKRKT